MKKTASSHKQWLEAHGRWATFTHRSTMTRLERPKAALPPAFPTVTLPIDCTGNATVSCPMLGNDQYGDCGPAMCAHLDEIRTYGQGKPGFTEAAVNQAALIAQYEQVSGGDNGTNEPMLVGPGGIWLSGIAGDPAAVVVDHLDVDVTDGPLTQFCIDLFYGICMAWSVPDAFLQGFAPGTIWDSAATPNPHNGHYTALADVDSAGRLRCWTWGSWCWLGSAFIASVDPACFVTFSPLQFSAATGYDSHGRHVSEVASSWVAIGGNAAIASAVVDRFPPKPAPPPVPVPVPPPGTPVTLAAAQAWAAAGIGAGDAIQTREQATSNASAGLAKNWPPA